MKKFHGGLDCDKNKGYIKRTSVYIHEEMSLIPSGKKKVSKYICGQNKKKTFFQ